MIARARVVAWWLATAACSEPARDVTVVTLAPSAEVAESATWSAAPERDRVGSLMQTARPAHLDPDAIWDGRWPLPPAAMPHHDSGSPDGFADSAQVCTTVAGQPGITVNGKQCFNPCLQGTAPAAWDRCVRECQADADCTRDGRRGTCSLRVGKALLCDRPLTMLCSSGAPSSACTTPEGTRGVECPGDYCYDEAWACRDGYAGVGFALGHRCAKLCTADAECPRGRCVHAKPGATGECSPTCPGEGCPSLWD